MMQIFIMIKNNKKNLQNQMANKVNWTQSIKKLEEIGENKIIEIGPNKILSGLIKRISNNFDIKSINKISDLNKMNENKKIFITGASGGIGSAICKKFKDKKFTLSFNIFF